MMSAAMIYVWSPRESSSARERLDPIAAWRPAIVLFLIAPSPVRAATSAPASVLTSCVQLLSYKHAEPQLLSAALRTRSHAAPLAGRFIISAWEIQMPLGAAPLSCFSTVIFSLKKNQPETINIPAARKTSINFFEDVTFLFFSFFVFAADAGVYCLRSTNQTFPTSPEVFPNPPHPPCRPG